MSFAFRSTFTTGSGFSSPVCPVSVMTSSFPCSFTMAWLTHFLRAKSKYFTLTFSISMSSSSGSSFPGVESTSSTGSPSSSVSSEISAVFIRIRSDVFGSVTLKAILTSLWSGLVSLSPAFLLNHFSKFAPYSFSWSLDR